MRLCSDQRVQWSARPPRRKRRCRFPSHAIAATWLLSTALVDTPLDRDISPSIGARGFSAAIWYWVLFIPVKAFVPVQAFFAVSFRLSLFSEKSARIFTELFVFSNFENEAVFKAHNRMEPSYLLPGLRSLNPPLWPGVSVPPSDSTGCWAPIAISWEGGSFSPFMARETVSCYAAPAPPPCSMSRGCPNRLFCHHL